MRHRTKFCTHQSNRCRHMAIFPFFKMAAIRHFGFFNFNCQHNLEGQYASFCVDWYRSNRYIASAIFRFFQNGGHPPYLICFMQFWTTHKEHLVVCYCAKFGSFRCISFDNAALAWCLFMPPFGFLGPLDRWMGSDINKTPKRHISLWKDFVWHIDRQNQFGPLVWPVRVTKRPKKKERKKDK